VRRAGTGPKFVAGLPQGFRTKRAILDARPDVGSRLLI
jgi:hypothetical protein